MARVFHVASVTMKIGGVTYSPRTSTPRARPICDVCGTPVESFEETRDEFMLRVRFTARCHGETELVDVPIEEARGITFGRAFVRPLALPAGSP